MDTVELSYFVAPFSGLTNKMDKLTSIGLRVDSNENIKILTKGTETASLEMANKIRELTSGKPDLFIPYLEISLVTSRLTKQ